mmetsp:Transcript_7789/g.8925  ORF Transcript_7789/g.8925 Transcript_7789/m.8925 type:complete len:205 (+) Transcript_7789:118-732(+)|eukprot:CAMPEP_0194145396 /NCGR_PEP_ID=MMETSP0152-20130528/17384_1 /TAXON_ID=1049557 /ORGANISM="Thalassiothrix antarctica, Strain L6-D1" /LENGTH=204 /DNA_ID=CAMNT_0038845627 /DNA_START=87 /DNA_END=701 /DNA_ORIENTATION=+
MKASIFASLLATAAAFAPLTNDAKTSSLNAFEDAIGAQEPLGFFDPLGLLNDADEERFNRLRNVEIKHGRIAMLAFVGNLVPRAGLYFPGNIDLKGDAFSSFPPGIAAVLGDDACPREGLGQIVLIIGLLELFVMKDVTGQSEFPGDIRNGFDFGWDTFGENEKKFKRAIELNNGRAAMMGILGLMVHEEIEGNPVVGLFLSYN